MIRIYASYVNSDFETEEYEELLRYVDKQSRDKIERFYKRSDAIRETVSNVLIRAMIIEALGMNNNNIIFYKNEYGRPFLKGISNFHFNISHSGDWVICVIADKMIGIDIEKIEPIDFEAAEQFCTAEEKNKLLAMHGNEKLEYFYDLWTLKESYVKALGKGLSISLKSFTIKVCSGGKVEFKTDSGEDHYFFKRYNIDSYYKTAVCSIADIFPEEIIIKSKSEILSILGC